MVLLLCYSCNTIAVGLDFKGGSYVGVFTANEISAEIHIPIVKDLISTEGTECFMVHLSVPSNSSDNVVVSLGDIREATVCIQDEIILSFGKQSIQVEEGENLTLSVTANTVSDEDYTISVNITSNSGHCKLNYKYTDHFLMVGSCI